MGRYGFAPSIVAVSSKPQWVIGGDGNVLPEICLLHIASPTAPDDHQFDFTLEDFSDIGTGGTSLTVERIGPCAASSMTAKKATWSTTDPTITASTASRLGLGLYRRGKAQFQFPLGEGIRPLALASNKGLGVYCQSAGTGSVSFRHTANWYE